MSKRTTGMFGAIVLTIFLAVSTGPALAGNGNGKADEHAQAGQSASTAPGNSGDAPGHNKGSVQASASTQTSVSAHGSATQNSAAKAGMKPTNSTSKNTTCTTGGGGGSAVTCAPSSSNSAAVQVGTKDASKRYGNGQTAAQIATSNGVSAGATLYGPGNSQPHKVQACGKANGHWVDVHAVKHVGTAACSTSTSTHTMTSQNGTTSVTGSTTVTAKTQGNGVAVGHSTGGVLGATATAPSGNASPLGGVLGALTTVGQGTLPFTGFPVWAALALALALIAGGLGLRRAARPSM